MIIIACGLNLSMKNKQLKNLLSGVCSKKVCRNGCYWVD